MPKEKTDWAKFTVRLDKETVHLMHKYCKEPTPIIRELIRAWVRKITKEALEQEAQRKQAGENIKW